MKHTRGEWFAQDNGFVKSKWIDEDGGNNGAIICELKYSKDKEANAQLIAQSPELLRQRDELLECLKELVEDIGEIKAYTHREFISLELYRKSEQLIKSIEK